MITHEHLVHDATGKAVAVVLPVDAFEALRQTYARHLHAVRVLRMEGFIIAAIGSILGLSHATIHEHLDATGGDPLDLTPDHLANDVATLERWEG